MLTAWSAKKESLLVSGISALWFHPAFSALEEL
ncbi:Uncharacterised protein [Vibrio cholerae]|nr:Uncharacterised protein [Vibrio cholerae]